MDRRQEEDCRPKKCWPGASGNYAADGLGDGGEDDLSNSMTAAE